MAESPDEKRLRALEHLNREFMGTVPHNMALGLEFLELCDAEARMRLPYSTEIVGHPETGVIHGGAITALMDACSGAAVFMALSEPITLATLDLRIDYLKPATPGQAVIARAECYKVTRNVAFARCVAYHHSEEDPVASAAGAFMLSSPSPKKEHA